MIISGGSIQLWDNAEKIMKDSMNRNKWSRQRTKYFLGGNMIFWNVIYYDKKPQVDCFALIPCLRWVDSPWLRGRSE